MNAFATLQTPPGTHTRHITPTPLGGSLMYRTNSTPSHARVCVCVCVCVLCVCVLCVCVCVCVCCVCVCVLCACVCVLCACVCVLCACVCVCCVCVCVCVHVCACVCVVCVLCVKTKHTLGVIPLQRTHSGGGVTLGMYGPGPKSDRWVESMSGGGTFMISMSSEGGTK